MQFAFLKDWKTVAHRLCCKRELLGVAASVGIKIAPLVSNFTEPGDYAMYYKAPDYEKWLEAMIKEIKELEKMGCWKIVKLTSLSPGAKLINCRWVYKLKFRDGLYERHRARLVAMGYQHEIMGVIVSRAFRLPSHTLPFVSWLHSQPFLVGIHWIRMPCALSFQVTLLRESVSIWKARLVTILVRVIAYTCSSAYTATCKHLVNITCSVVKFARRLAWSNFIQMLKICGYRCRSVKNLWSQMQKNKDLWLQMQKSKEANCEVDARVWEGDQAGWSINLRREGELDWFFSVRYTYDKVTGAIGLIRKLTSIASWSSMAWLMRMRASCRWIQAPTLTRCLSRRARQNCHACLRCSDWWASLHGYQHSTSTSLLDEQFDSTHVKGNASTSCLCQSGAQISHWRHRETAHIVW